MFGSFLDAVMSIPQNMHKEEMQDDAQHHDYMAQWRNQVYNKEEAEIGRNFNSAQAVAQRDWLERMSNTQHQRQVGDLRAAGLNPILSARAGAGVPSASSASGNAASSSGGGGSGSGAGGSTGTSAFNNSDFNNLQRAQAITQTQMGYNVSMDTQLKESQGELLREETRTQRQHTRRAEADADTATSNAKGRALEGQIDETKYGEIMRYIDRAMNAIRGGSSALEQHRNPVREHRRVR